MPFVFVGASDALADDRRTDSLSYQGKWGATHHLLQHVCYVATLQRDSVVAPHLNGEGTAYGATLGDTKWHRVATYVSSPDSSSNQGATHRASVPLQAVQAACKHCHLARKIHPLRRQSQRILHPLTALWGRDATARAAGSQSEHTSPMSQLSSRLIRRLCGNGRDALRGGSRHQLQPLSGLCAVSTLQQFRFSSGSLLGGSVISWTAAALSKVASTSVTSSGAISPPLVGRRESIPSPS